MPVKDSKLTQPLKWHGGKYYLADAITKLFPEHTHYVEPYFGGGAVLFRKPESLIVGHSEVINDVYGELMNFWRVLKDESAFSALRTKLEFTPFAKPIWQSLIDLQNDDPVDRALAFFVRYRQSRQGLGKEFATMSRNRTRRGMNEQVSAWLSAIDGLEAAHHRLQRVVILCEDANKVIAREDGQSTLFYLDPPYLHETRIAKEAYQFEMAMHDHERLLEMLGGISGKFILSGYRNELYDRASDQYSWSRIDIPIDNKASGSHVKPLKVESLWTNF